MWGTQAPGLSRGSAEPGRRVHPAGPGADELRELRGWESGQTKVGVDHLVNLGDAFHVGNDLWRLVYAWLTDHLVPRPDCEPAEVTDARLEALLCALPQREVDVGEFADMVLGCLTHAHLAQLGLIARYGCGYAGADRRLVLPPAGRGTLPHGSGRCAGPPSGVRRRRARRPALRRPDVHPRRLQGVGGRAAAPGARYTWLLLSEPEWFMRLLPASHPSPGGWPTGSRRVTVPIGIWQATGHRSWCPVRQARRGRSSQQLEEAGTLF